MPAVEVSPLLGASPALVPPSVPPPPIPPKLLASVRGGAKLPAIVEIADDKGGTGGEGGA